MSVLPWRDDLPIYRVQHGVRSSLISAKQILGVPYLIVIQFPDGAGKELFILDSCQGPEHYRFSDIGRGNALRRAREVVSETDILMPLREKIQEQEFSYKLVPAPMLPLYNVWGDLFDDMARKLLVSVDAYLYTSETTNIEETISYMYEMLWWFPEGCPIPDLNRMQSLSSFIFEECKTKPALSGYTLLQVGVLYDLLSKAAVE